MSRTRPPKAVRSILYIHWKLRYYPSNNPMNYLATNVTKKLDHNTVAQTYLKLMGGFAKQLGIASETGEIMNETDE